MKKPLLFAVICGILAALLAGLHFSTVETRYRNSAQQVKVFVAKQYIDQGTFLDETLVEERSVPKEYLQPKAIQSLKELTTNEGKRTFMSIVPLEKGEQIVTTKLSLLGLDTGLAAIIPNERRAVTLSFDGETVSGLVKPGNRVDVIGIFEYEDKNNQRQEAAFTVLQNVLVLSVGHAFLGTTKPVGNKSSDGTGMVQELEQSGSVPVSLAVTPKEAETVVLASERGRIRFSLRAMGDDAVSQTGGTRIRDICADGTSTLRQDKSAGMSQATMKELQNKQKEVMELLRKYQK